MVSQLFGILLTVLILFLGILFLGLLLKRYQGRLLANFHQKIVMTLALGFVYLLFFCLGNGFLYFWINSHFDPKVLSSYTANLGFFIRAALFFFALNACLILAVRAMIRTLYGRLRKADHHDSDVALQSLKSKLEK